MAGKTKLPGQLTRRDILKFLVSIMVRLISRVDLGGIENLPKSGAAVIVINHIAFLDPVVVGVSLPRHVVPMAKREAFDLPFLGWLTKLYGSIPVQRGEVDLAAIKLALRALKAGELLLMAPEGTRSPTHQLQAGKEGAIMFALRSGAPIVPIGVTGTELVKSYWWRFRRTPVRISIGKPFYLAQSSRKRTISRETMSEMIQETMHRLAAELPASYRGVYADLNSATDSHLVFFEDQRFSNEIQT